MRREYHIDVLFELFALAGVGLEVRKSNQALSAAAASGCGVDVAPIVSPGEDRVAAPFAVSLNRYLAGQCRWTQTRENDRQRILTGLAFRGNRDHELLNGLTRKMEMNVSAHSIEPAETPQPRLLWAHKAAIWGIGKLPQFNNYMPFRAYDKALRLFRQEYIGKTYFGALMHCNLSDLIQSYVFHFGVWEPEISHLVGRILKPDDVFVDVGANVGYDSLLGSSLVGSQGQVIAIEASPTTFAKLKQNIALNKSTNIRAVNVAVSDHVGTLDLFDVSERNCGAATTLAGRGGKLIASVDALPLAQILTPVELRSVRLIKIDVEGAEPMILNNILDNIEAFPASMDLIVEFSPDDAEASSRVFSRMTQAGYYAYAVENDYEKDRYLSNRPLSPLVFTDTVPLTQCDLLYTRAKKSSC